MIYSLWHYGWHLFVCMCVLVRESLCLFWRETHTKGLRARSPTRPEEDEGRKIPERQPAEGSSRDQSTGEVSQEKDTVSRREQKRPVDRTGLPGDESWAERGDQSTEVSIASGFVRVFARVHARVSLQDAQKVSQTSPSGAGN